jgi:hypothetical protein
VGETEKHLGSSQSRDMGSLRDWDLVIGPMPYIYIEGLTERVSFTAPNYEEK